MNSQEKQKYILLSKIAKERKYAQEYLSLLARRGDLGSIRIGKRWYTTAQWMDEFIEETARRKEEIANPMKFSQIEKIDKPVEKLIEKIGTPSEARVSSVKISEAKEETVLDLEEEKLKVKESFFEKEAVPAREEFFQPRKEAQTLHAEAVLSKYVPEEAKPETKREVISPVVEDKVFQEERIVEFQAPTQVYEKARYEKQILPNSRQKKAHGEVIDLRKMISSGEKNISVKTVQGERRAEKTRQAILAPAVRREKETLSFSSQYYDSKGAPKSQVKKDSHFHSPNFGLQEAADMVWQSLFSKLAISFVVLLLLVVLSGGLIFQKDLRETAATDAGRVAGASDSRVGRGAGALYSVVAGAATNGVSGVALIEPSVDSYIGSINNKIRENISLSRVIIESAVQE